MTKFTAPEDGIVRVNDQKYDPINYPLEDKEKEIVNLLSSVVYLKTWKEKHKNLRVGSSRKGCWRII